MTVEEQRWLALLGITSVGSLTRACVTGEVRDLVHHQTVPSFSSVPAVQPTGFHFHIR